MLANLLFVLLLLLIFVSNYLRGLTLLWPGLALAVFAICLLIRFRQVRKRNDFLGQLKSQRRELRRGSTVSVDGAVLRYTTLLRAYSVSVGIVFTSIEIPTSFRITDGESQLESLWYSLLTLLTGWWSLTGPVQTMASLSQNLGPSGTKSVAELIDSAYLRRIEAAENQEFSESSAT